LRFDLSCVGGSARQGVSLTLEPQLAQVSSAGKVFWSRPGSIVILCRFSGIVNFPFDYPICEAEFGGWVYSGAVQGIATSSTYSIASERTAQPAYSEFNLTAVNVTINGASYQYDDFVTEGAPDPWPTVSYTFTLRRVGAQVWAYVLIVPNILLALLSCAASFLRPDVGERLGFGITLILAIEVTRIVMVEHVPNCGEMLSVSIIITECSFVAYFSLLQSCLVLYLHHREPMLLPSPPNPPSLAKNASGLLALIGQLPRAAVTVCSLSVRSRRVSLLTSPRPVCRVHRLYPRTASTGYTHARTVPTSPVQMTMSTSCPDGSPSSLLESSAAGRPR
jgi:hypothetical protein